MPEVTKPPGYHEQHGCHDCPNLKSSSYRDCSLPYCKVIGGYPPGYCICDDHPSQRHWQTLSTKEKNVAMEKGHEAAKNSTSRFGPADKKEKPNVDSSR